ncbi:MAG: hypothetical protein COA74_11980 [Gammaproteobacteria bacterium]|nr:MAG: hypothetical protein COA74_11980 [Gammaproteobacteria bacterium]
MIEQTIEKWHSFVNDQQPKILDELLAEDVVFYSPVTFKAQQGKALTTMYLTAAAATFTASGIFNYTKEVLSGNQAVLEFESELEGIYINGVDIITCDENGQITEFKVMIRPLQAVNVLHKQMKEMLLKRRKLNDEN